MAQLRGARPLAAREDAVSLVPDRAADGRLAVPDRGVDDSLWSSLTRKSMVTWQGTNSPSNPNVVSRIHRLPRGLPCQCTSKLTWPGREAGDGETAFRKSWKSGTARCRLWNRARPVRTCPSIASSDIAIVQNRPDALMPGSKS